MVVTDIGGVDDGVGAVVTLGNTNAVIGTVNLCPFFSVQQQQQRLNSSRGDQYTIVPVVSIVFATPTIGEYE